MKRAPSLLKLAFVSHKWVGVVAALVLAVIASTGILLLAKKYVPWIQPTERTGAAPNSPTISFDDILAACRTDPRLEISTWADVNRLDVRPARGIVKVRARNDWEAQIDLASGELLQVAYRRSDLIESIHDGSFFADWAHTVLWPAAALSLLFLILSGLFLWLKPKLRRSRR
ncbi:MAG: PepSY-associated TM helix domain-containing protein [Planctomycetota bacterium]|nr:PepSY-associated TM helix domain-containing protein [Planctomycetota bacterium]